MNRSTTADFPMPLSPATTTSTRNLVSDAVTHVTQRQSGNGAEQLYAVGAFLSAFGEPGFDAVQRYIDSYLKHMHVEEADVLPAARALALIHGRDYVLPTDVQAVAKDVMSHRLVLGFDAVADNIAPSQVVERIVAMVPPPTPVWNQQQRDQSHTQHRHNPSYPS